MVIETNCHTATHNETLVIIRQNSQHSRLNFFSCCACRWFHKLRKDFEQILKKIHIFLGFYKISRINIIKYVAKVKFFSLYSLKMWSKSEFNKRINEAWFTLEPNQLRKCLFLGAMHNISLSLPYALSLSILFSWEKFCHFTYGNPIFTTNTIVLNFLQAFFLLHINDIDDVLLTYIHILLIFQ